MSRNVLMSILILHALRLRELKWINFSCMSLSSYLLHLKFYRLTIQGPSKTELLMPRRQAR